jgi:hypothetical protein
VEFKSNIVELDGDIEALKRTLDIFGEFLPWTAKVWK